MWLNILETNNTSNNSSTNYKHQSILLKKYNRLTSEELLSND